MDREWRSWVALCRNGAYLLHGLLECCRDFVEGAGTVEVVRRIGHVDNFAAHCECGLLEDIDLRLWHDIAEPLRGDLVLWRDHRNHLPRRRRGSSPDRTIKAITCLCQKDTCFPFSS